MSKEHSKPMRRFLKVTSEKARIGKCCQILIKTMCHSCQYAKSEKIMLFKTIKVPDIDTRICMNCVNLMYKRAYGEELKDWDKGCIK